MENDHQELLDQCKSIVSDIETMTNFQKKNDDEFITVKEFKVFHRLLNLKLQELNDD